MRRAALPLLLRLVERVPSEQLLQQSQLTQLQALLLQATGHISFSSPLLSRSPSQLGRTLFGVSAEDDGSARGTRSNSEDGIETSGEKSEGGDKGGGQMAVCATITGQRRRRRGSIPLDDEMQLLILPSRTRRASRARAASPKPAPEPSPEQTRSSQLDSNPPLLAARPTAQSQPETSLPSSCPPPPPAAALGVSMTAQKTELTAAEAAASAPESPCSAFSEGAAAASAGAAAAEASAAAANRLPAAEVTPSSWRRRGAWRHPSREHCTGPSEPQAPPEARSDWQQRHPPVAAEDAAAAAEASRPRIVGSGSSPSRAPRPPRPVHELLDEMEEGALPLPSPRQLLESLEAWRKGRRGEGDPSGLRELAARLDRVLAPRLRGEYGKDMPMKYQVFLLWSLAKAGFWGDAATALAQRLQDTVRPDMPYGKDDYWASLAFYSLGLAQQAAAGAGAVPSAVHAVPGGGGGAGRGGGAAAAAAAALVGRYRERLAPALLQLLGRNARTINLQALSNTFWAAGLLQLRDRKALSALAEQAFRRAAQAQSQNIANILYGCAMLGLSDKEWAAIQGPYPFLERLLSETVQRRLLGFQPLEASCVAWAAVKLPGVKPTPVLETLASFVDGAGFDGVTSSQVWANTVYAMGLTDFYDPRVFQRLTLALLGDPYQQQRKQQQRLRPLGGVTSQPPPPPMPPLLRSATAQTCCNILFAMGVVRHLDERVVDALLARMVAVTAGAGARAAVIDIALAVRACAQLNYRSPKVDELLDAALPAMRAQAPKLMAYNVLWSLLTLDMLTEPRHQALVRHLVYCVNRYGTTTWKSTAAAAEAVSSSSSSSSSAAAGAGLWGPEMAAYDDLTQLVQYHLESRQVGLTGPEYDLTPPGAGMDTAVRQIRARRREIAAQSSTIVHRNVVTMLRDMAATQNGVLPADPRIRILSVESEVMLEPELVVVDVLLTLEVRQDRGSNSDPDSRMEGLDHADRPLLEGCGAGAGGSRPAPPNPTSTSSSTLDTGSTTAFTYQLALEVDGPHHFMRNRPGHQDGPSAYRDRVLRRRLGGGGGGGPGVAVVPTSLWVERLRDDGERRSHLAELLASTAPAASARR